MNRNGTLAAVLSLATAIFFWSSVPLLLKFFSHRLDAWTVNGLRYTFAALFWLPYVLRHVHEVPPGRNIWKDALPPAIIHLVGQMLFGLTPYFNDATVINFVSRSSFLFTTLLGFSLLREERPLARRPLFWVGFGGTAAGLIALYIGGLGTTSTSAAGMILLIVTASCWGFYSVLVRKFMHGYSPRVSFGVISLYAAPGLIALMFGVGDWHPVLSLSLRIWVLIWISAIAGIALGHVLFYRAIHTLGPIASEGSLLFIPFATAILAYGALGERMGSLQWIGGLILVASCLFLVVAKAQTHRAHREETLVTSTAD
ncbi:MAG TPA: DMT family transporter [Kiritimatiellia bacterium]|nr:DMT family transporter [Kiritimatiellia bacterium]